MVTTLRIGIVSLFAAILATAVFGLPTGPGGLTGTVEAEIHRSGAEHPVTAVLLNFRGYDTWLEVAVLLLAVMSLMALHRIADLRAVPVLAAPSTLLVWLARMLAPAAVAAGGYLLWLGTHAPGGAFQAGAVWAAALVLLRLAGFPSIAAVRTWRLRGLLLLGFTAFLAVATWRFAAGHHLLEYGPAWAGTAITLIELGVGVATALTLSAMFVGARSMAPTDGSKTT